MIETRNACGGFVGWVKKTPRSVSGGCLFTPPKKINNSNHNPDDPNTSTASSLPLWKMSTTKLHHLREVLSTHLKNCWPSDPSVDPWIISQSFHPPPLVTLKWYPAQGMKSAILVGKPPCFAKEFVKVPTFKTSYGCFSLHLACFFKRPMTPTPPLNLLNGWFS